ncbi:MAG: TIGR00282 family metallophosphoesterase [Pseudomonadota bacterium]|nr:TIGR00282 family metallophosphoesterase [Pseudomonadota bacterium]
MNILFLGDLVGESIVAFLKKNLPNILTKYDISFVIVNGENIANGYGITPHLCDQLFEIGIDVISSGNHIWDQEKIIPYIAQQKKLIRPINYSRNSPGQGISKFTNKQGDKIVVINLSCNLFMQKANNAFSEIKDLLNNLKLKQDCDAIFIDLHGEAASEKQALAYMIDGQVTAVLGTHTHVPTSDLRILPKGTAFQTDTGMCGDYDSVIGGEKQSWIEKFTSKGNYKKINCSNKNITLCGSIVKVDKMSGLASVVEQIVIGGILKNIIPNEILFKNV